MSNNRAVFLIAAACLLMFFAGCAGTPAVGAVRVRALDGYSGRPLEGACVTVPETGGRFTTDATGLTELMTLPVIKDSEYEELLPCPSGRITLLVSADGYTPYLLLYARVREGETRTIDALLFPADGSLDVFTVIEAPDESWCEQLMLKNLP